MPESAPARPRILVADDQVDLLEMLKEALETEGYAVTTVPDGTQALARIREAPPDIAVIDLYMPGKSGFEVCQELKQDPTLQHLPLIIFSASNSRDNRIQGLDLGADDFLTKPVDLAELLARIRMIIKRTRQGLDANPLTRLPGNVSIEARISQAIAGGKPFGVLYLDLNNFKAYNDVYGFDAGDQVIKATAQILLEQNKAVADGKDFVGHIGGDDFIVVTETERMEKFAQGVIAAFDKAAPGFYNEKDRAQGKIVAVDRRGIQTEYPLLSIAIGVCHNMLKRLTAYAQVSQIGAELKKFAKRNPQSSYVVDRRKD